MSPSTQFRLFRRRASNPACHGHPVQKGEGLNIPTDNRTTKTLHKTFLPTHESNSGTCVCNSKASNRYTTDASDSTLNSGENILPSFFITEDAILHHRRREMRAAVFTSPCIIYCNIRGEESATGHTQGRSKTGSLFIQQWRQGPSLIQRSAQRLLTKLSPALFQYQHITIVTVFMSQSIRFRSFLCQFKNIKNNEKRSSLWP